MDKIEENWAYQHFTLPEDGGEHFANLVKEGKSTTCGDQKEDSIVLKTTI